MRHHSASTPALVTERPTATGFEFEPLPTGEVLIEFFADDGKTINTQVITRDGLARLPVVVHAFFLAVEEGPDAAIAFLDRLSAGEGQQRPRHPTKPPPMSWSDMQPHCRSCKSSTTWP